MSLHATHVANVPPRVRAVVVQVHHDRVLGDTESVELLEQPTDVLVDVGDHRRDPGELVGLGRKVHADRREIPDGEDGEGDRQNGKRAAPGAAPDEAGDRPGRTDAGKRCGDGRRSAYGRNFPKLSACSRHEVPPTVVRRLEKVKPLPKRDLGRKSLALDRMLRFHFVYLDCFQFRAICSKFR